MTNAVSPLCDMDPNHGPMQQEPIHKLDGQIDTDFGSYWFCQALGCDGYGGRVEKEPRKVIVTEPAESLQLQLM